MINIYTSFSALQKDVSYLMDDNASDEVIKDSFFNILVTKTLISQFLENRFIRYNKLLPSNDTFQFIKKNKEKKDLVKQYIMYDVKRSRKMVFLTMLRVLNVTNNIRLIFDDIPLEYIETIKEILDSLSLDTQLFRDREYEIVSDVGMRN